MTCVLLSCSVSIPAHYRQLIRNRPLGDLTTALLAGPGTASVVTLGPAGSSGMMLSLDKCREERVGTLDAAFDERARLLPLPSMVRNVELMLEDEAKTEELPHDSSDQELCASFSPSDPSSSLSSPPS